MSERCPRVLLADDHPMMLEGLRKLLEPDCEVVGVVTDGRAPGSRGDAAAGPRDHRHLDAGDRRHRGHAPAAEVAPEVRVLILSMHTEPSWVRAAFEAGACGYLTKSSAPEEIEPAVREVLEGRFYVSPAVTRAAVVSL